MRLMSIASGSGGNCIYVGTDSTSVLVDVGISKKRIGESLREIDHDFSDIDGILITHEHIDHVAGLGVISRSYGIPIYATRETCQALTQIKKLGEFDQSLLHPIEPDERLAIGDLSFEAHSIWHDGVDPVCYSLYYQGKKVSIATDMGDYDGYLVNALKDSDVLLVETNHDIRMLQAGPYPYALKQRIMGKRGHLSNEAGGKLLSQLLNNHIKGIFLGHLSKENNYPELAYESVRLELMRNPYTEDVRDFNLQVASRDRASCLLEI